MKTGSDGCGVNVRAAGGYSPDTTTQILPAQLRGAVQDASERTIQERPPASAAAQDPGKAVAPSTAVNIKGFRVLRELGAGGMATAYLAERTSDKERLVLKVFVAHDGYDIAMLDRFILEHAAI